MFLWDGEATRAYALSAWCLNLMGVFVNPLVPGSSPGRGANSKWLGVIVVTALGVFVYLVSGSICRATERYLLPRQDSTSDFAGVTPNNCWARERLAQRIGD